MLAIALIGLYKAAKYKAGGGTSEGASGAGTQAAKEKDSSGVFSMLMDFIGIYALVLVPLGFMFLFTFGIKKITELNAPELREAEVERVVVDDQSSELEVMFAAALQINSPTRMNEQLTEVVDLAIEKRDFGVAIQAASAISSPSRSDEQLKRIMSAAAASTPDQAPEAAQNRGDNNGEKSD